MKILFLGPLPPPVTGHSLACKVLHDALVAEHAVQTIDLNKKEFSQGVSSVNRVVSIAGILWRIWRAREFGDVIYLTPAESIAGNMKDLVIYLACFFQLDRMVIHLHGGAGLKVLLSDRHKLLRAVNRFFLRRIAGAIVLGARHRAVFAGLVDDRKIHEVPNFAEDYLFLDDDQIQAKFSSCKPLRLLFLSNLLPGKGHIELLAALQMLAEHERSHLQVDFAGGFESVRQRDEFLLSIGGCRQFVYHGVVSGNAKLALFAQAHVFCLPTYYPYEGQPISILEAYASGCAVMTTDHSGIFDVFSDPLNGFEVLPRSAESIATVLRTILADPSGLLGLALANARTARKQYRAVKFTDAVSDVLHEATGHVDRLLPRR